MGRKNTFEGMLNIGKQHTQKIAKKRLLDLYAVGSKEVFFIFWFVTYLGPMDHMPWESMCEYFSLLKILSLGFLHSRNIRRGESKRHRDLENIRNLVECKRKGSYHIV